MTGIMSRSHAAQKSRKAIISRCLVLRTVALANNKRLQFVRILILGASRGRIIIQLRQLSRRKEQPFVTVSIGHAPQDNFSDMDNNRYEAAGPMESFLGGLKRK